jgi:hypothetical protein
MFGGPACWLADLGLLNPSFHPVNELVLLHHATVICAEVMMRSTASMASLLSKSISTNLIPMTNACSSDRDIVRLSYIPIL